MQKNENTMDRVIRILFGLTLLGLAVLGPKSPWGWIGVVPLATGIIGFCPLYRLVGISTCPIAMPKQRT